MPRARSNKSGTPKKPSTAPAAVPFPTLQAFIDGGGHFDIGYIHPIDCAAIANDDHNMYVALLRRRGESLMDLLARLDASLKHCLENDDIIDEINAPPSSRRR